MGWGHATPFNDYCIAGTIADGDDRLEQRIKMILQHSVEVFGVELRPMNMQGGIISTTKVASSSALRTEGTPNYLTCDELDHAMLMAATYAKQSGEQNAACGDIAFTCQCNSSWNTKAHNSIYESLEIAVLWSKESQDVETCSTLEAQAYAAELQAYTESLWVAEEDVEGDNKRVLLAMVGSSVLMIGGLMLMTKGR